jgi:signal transduction histidine kinase
MRWLADHLQSSYGAAASCEDDGMEPQLSSEVRTIAFRAIRELANNAVKHAPDARIVLRLIVDNAGCRLEVCDNGPGFERGADHTAPHGHKPFPGYGLLSVEQQIRAVGGTFEILTAPGKGTQAIITLGRSSDTQGQEQADA